MAAHAQGSPMPEFVASYLVAADGKQKERYKLREDYVNRLETDYILQKRSRFGLKEGLQWKPEFFPKQLIFQRGKKLYGYNSQNNSGTLVSQTFKMLKGSVPFDSLIMSISCGYVANIYINSS